jgi:Domain of unknown function (DUF397)
MMRSFRSTKRIARNDSIESAEPHWVKSSFSYANGMCVEVAGLSDDVIMVRDSKNAKGAVLGFTPGEWDAFVGGVRNGEFDRHR